MKSTESRSGYGPGNFRLKFESFYFLQTNFIFSFFWKNTSIFLKSEAPHQKISEFQYKPPTLQTYRESIQALVFFFFYGDHFGCLDPDPQAHRNSRSTTLIKSDSLDGLPHTGIYVQRQLLMKVRKSLNWLTKIIDVEDRILPFLFYFGQDSSGQ